MSEVFDLVPDNWSVFELGSLGTTYSGLSGKNKDNFGRGKKYIPYMNIYSNPSIDPEWMELVQLSANEKQNRVQRGDIFFTTSSETPDEVGISSVLLTEVGECYLNSFCFGFRPNNFEAFIPEYAQHFFRSELFRRQMYELAQGATRYNLSKKSTLGTMVLLPPLPEQRKIAEILGTWDEAIRLTADLIAAKQQRKKGLMQRLLTGEVRFLGFEGRPWRETTLAEFFYSFSELNKKGEDLTVLSCSKIHGIVPQTQIFDKRVASADTKRYKVVYAGDLVYDPMLLWDASIGFVDSVEKGVISPAYATFKFKAETGVAPRYFNYLFKTHLFRHHYKVISQGTNVRRRKALPETFLNLDVFIPSDNEEISKITEFFQACDHEIDLLQQKLAALQQQKKGLMQRLLTGEVRVKV